jgi:hypothetical protein
VLSKPPPPTTASARARAPTLGTVRPASAAPSRYGGTSRSASGSSSGRGTATANRDLPPTDRSAAAISPVVTTCGGTNPAACEVQVTHWCCSSATITSPSENST